MGCHETQSFIHAYLDAELDLVRAVEIERHLADCPLCGQLYQNQLALRSGIRTAAPYYKAPEQLSRRIEAVLHRQEEPGPRAIGRGFVWPVRALPAWGLPALAAVFAVLAAVGWYLAATSPKPSPRVMLAEEVLASHIRSLMPNHLTDVPSSNQHTVKPWFDGKLDFSPPVEDLSSEGFPLVGGRLDYLGGRPVAALVYQRGKHFINLFVWPQAGKSPPELMTQQGYHLLHWSAAGLTFWAVSDVDETGLETFARLFQHGLLPAP